MRFVRPSTVVTVIAIGSIVVVLALLWSFGLERRRSFFANIASCRNHATFLAQHLAAYICRDGRLPYDPALAPDELVAILVAHSDGADTNCTAGGWQMVNASPTTWIAILDAIPADPVPFIWCGFPHGRGTPGRRVVFALQPRSTLRDAIRKGPDFLRALDPYDFWGAVSESILYQSLSEAALEETLSRVNDVLAGHAERTVALNISGTAD